MSLVDQHRGRALTESQREWLRVREHLQRHRYKLGQAAADLYPDNMRVGGTPLLSRLDWLPPEPIPLDAIDLAFTPDVPFTGLAGDDRATISLRPQRPDGSRYPTYSAAMAELASPAVFENRSTYRMQSAQLTGDRGRLVFGPGTYFDGIDLGEAAAHEYAAARIDGTSTPLRDVIGEPSDPERRPTNLAISALTIRHDQHSGDARFLVHWRDPAKVGHAGGLHQVLPVGIFQPSSDHPWNEHNDFSLWRCLVREFAEELLGQAESDGASGPIDYDNWPFAARMISELHDGTIRAYCVGIGGDPLTLATDLLSVVVIDAPVFDDIFDGLVDRNAEGQLVRIRVTSLDRLPGVPFVESEVKRLTRREPMQAAGAAVVATAWRYREQLLY